MIFGFQVQKMLSPEWTLGVRGSYSKKEYTEYILGSATLFTSPVYEVFYRQVSISLLFNRKIKEKISIGLGPNISHFSGWGSADDTYPVPTFPFEPFTVTKGAYGLDLQLGYYLGPVYLAVDYMRTLKVSDTSEYLTGASSLAITGTYFFELWKQK